MKKILLIGNSPLPSEQAKIRPAAGLRTFQFLKTIREQKNYDLKIVTIAMPECYEEIPKSGIADGEERLIISKDNVDLVQRVQKFHDEFDPDLIIAVNTYPSFVASKLNSRAILWCDLNGWIMAEAQAQAYKLGGNDFLSHYYKMEASILKKADKFSVVSGAEKYAVLGELAMLGRINKESFGYEFVEYIPNGIQWFEGENEKTDSDKLANLANLSKTNFIGLWIGGYNTWADEETLFKGLEMVMKRCENFYFVSTGGEIRGLDNKTFQKFKKMVDGSEFKERFVFLGWVESNLIPSIYRYGNLGLNVDRNCLETLTGARNRINEMLKFGLPVVTTLGSEISYSIVDFGAGVGVKSGDSKAFGEALTEMYKEWNGGGEKFINYKKRAVEYVEKYCDYKKTMVPLLNWLENPIKAPDGGVRVGFGAWGSLKGFWRYLKENGFKKSFGKFLQKLK